MSSTSPNHFIKSAWVCCFIFYADCENLERTQKLCQKVRILFNDGVSKSSVWQLGWCCFKKNLFEWEEKYFKLRSFPNPMYVLISSLISTPGPVWQLSSGSLLTRRSFRRLSPASSGRSPPSPSTSSTGTTEQLSYYQEFSSINNTAF